VVSWNFINDGFLTKAELIKSYHDAGDFLHVGALTDVLSNKQKIVDAQWVGSWLQKLATLLNHHHIYLADPPGTPIQKPADGIPVPKRQIVVLMQNAQDGKPYAHLFELLRSE
jgi:hypothetical protein